MSNKTDLNTVLQNRSYTKLLYGSYAENPTWVEFMNCITEVFNAGFGKSLIQLANVHIPENCSREVNVLSAKSLGYDFKNLLFTNEEYIRLLENLNLYARKKGTIHFISILGLIKNAHFNVYQLWTQDYKYFERESQWVTNHSILTDYKRVYDIIEVELNYGFVYNATEKDLDYGFVYNPVVQELDYGEITELSALKGLPDVNDPKYYENKFYPTSHVDLDYDLGAYQIDESDIRYLFYKLAPANLVLNYIDGVIYCDNASLYIVPVCNFLQSFDTFVCWAGYEGDLFTNALCHEAEYYMGNRGLYYIAPNYNKLVNVFDKGYKTLPQGFSCFRSSVATYVLNTWGNSKELKTVSKNTIRYIKHKGLLLEPSSTNLLTFSSTRDAKYVLLSPGTYTFSSFGLDGSKVRLAGVYANIVEANKYVTFTIEEPGGFYVYPDESITNVQLEKLPFPTSQIVCGSSSTTRESDTYLTQDTYIKNSTIFFKLNKIPEVQPRISYLFAYGTSFTDSLNVYIDEEGLLCVAVINNNALDIIYKTDKYKAGNEIGFKLTMSPQDIKDVEFENQVTPNNYNYILDIYFDVNSQESIKLGVCLSLMPSLFRFGSDWFSQNSLNGYITYFACLPDKVEVKQDITNEDETIEN